MRRPFLLFALPLLLCFATLLAGGQVSPGYPSFSSIDCHEVDCINIQNLDIVLNVPLRGKAGAFPFNFALQANSYVFVGTTGTWKLGLIATPVISQNLPGFVGSVNGYINDVQTILAAAAVLTNATCPDGVNQTIKYSSWFIELADGTVHWLPSSDMTDKRRDLSGLSCFNTSLTDQTIDGSGYTLTISQDHATSIYHKSGLNITQDAITDSNGNSVSRSNCCGALTYTDTLGTTAMSTSAYGSSPYSYTWTDVNGGSPAATVSYSSPTVLTNFGCSGISEYSGGGLPSSISFPDGTSLGILYEDTPGHTGDVTGRIKQLTLREGGTVSYAYSGGTHNGIDCTHQIPPTLKRTTSDGTTQYDWAAITGGNTTTVTDNGGNKTIYQFQGGILTQVKHYQGSSTLLTTDVYCYNAGGGQPGNCPTATPSLPITEKDVYHTINGMSNSSRSQSQIDKYGNVTYSAQYDFGGVSPVRATTITYGSCSASCTGASPTISAVGSNVNDKAGRVVTTQGGNTVAESRFTYDSKGNLLTKYAWTGSSWLSNVTVNSYNTNGTPSAVFDLANNETDFTYSSSNYSDGCNAFYALPFPTKVKDVGTGLYTQATYDCTGGVKLTDVDANGNTTTYGYVRNGGGADPFWRVSSVADPLGNTSYKDYGSNYVNPFFYFNSGNSGIDVTTWTDGYGRPVNVQKKEKPGDNTHFDTASTVYGWSSNYSTVATSQPCVQAYGVSDTCTTVHTNYLDPLGRLYQETTTSNETLTHTYTQNDDLAVLTPAPTGENAKQVQTEYDGLGRVSKVCQIGSTTSTGSGTACSQKTGSANGATDAYSYTSASGSSTVSITRVSQTRSKTFDALGRLISVTIPEGNPSGTTESYVYDTGGGCGSTHNGKLVAFGHPRDGQCFFYDGLGRLTSVKGLITWPNFTSCRWFYYDNSTGYSGTIPTGITISNGLGRMVEAATDDCSGTNLLTDEWFSYDKDGRVNDQWQSTPHSTQYYHSVATFFENGAVKTLQLASPSLYTMTYGLEGEGRWNTLTDTTASTNVVTGATFFPAANPAVISYTGTTPDNDAYTFDANTGRMTKFVFTVGNTPANLTGNLYWNANGTLGEVSTTDGFNAGNSYNCYSNATGSLGYGYDDWGRLNEFDCGSGNWGQQYSYDVYDNLTKTVLSGRTGTTWNPGYSSANNHCTGCTYDSDGNVLTDGSAVYTWNEFAKLKSVTTSGTVTCGSNGKCPVYDAFGRVVETSSGSTWTEWWITQLGTESMSGTTGNFGSFPTPGGNTAIVSGSIYILHKDWLGSARISSVATNHNVYADRGFTPYGEMYSNYGSTLARNDLFAGMTDSLDQGVMHDTPNRELSSVGRWLSPDPAGAGWNQYAYTTNPLSYVDPLGLGNCDSSDPSGCFPGPWPGPGGGGGGGSILDFVNYGYSLDFNSAGEVGSGTPFGPSSQMQSAMNVYLSCVKYNFQCDMNGNPQDVYGFTGGGGSILEKQIEFAAIQYGQLACKRQDSDSVVSCIQQVYDTLTAQYDPGQLQPPPAMEGGNYDFSYANIVINGENVYPQEFGCPLKRCGLFDSLDYSHNDGTFHIDTANVDFVPVGSLVHFFMDIVGGNTWWKNSGIPRP